ncbi:MAG: hypothetical protein RR692_03150 [Raoultibacter sp.]
MQDEKYTIISVSSDDEDEFVIQAGMPAGGKAVVKDFPESETPVSSDLESRGPQSKKERLAAEVEDLERTEEDLNSVPPMSKMQKTILAVIAAFVIVAIVYYFAFIR